MNPQDYVVNLGFSDSLEHPAVMPDYANSIKEVVERLDQRFGEQNLPMLSYMKGIVQDKELVQAIDEVMQVLKDKELNEWTAIELEETIKAAIKREEEYQLEQAKMIARRREQEAEMEEKGMLPDWLKGA